MSGVRDLALAAHAQRQREMDAQRQASKERQEREQAESDAERLDMVTRSPLGRWFPGVTWEIADRKQPQRTAVVRATDRAEGDPTFIVTNNGYAGSSPPSWHVEIAEHRPESGLRNEQFAYRRAISDAADIGEWIADRVRNCLEADLGESS